MAKSRLWGKVEENWRVKDGEKQMEAENAKLEL